jgi:hypothetical protein
MTSQGCPWHQRQRQELNNKIIIAPLYMRQIHTTLSPPPFSLITFHMKILYAFFRHPSELHVRPKLSLLLGHFNQIFTYIYCFLLLHAPPLSSLNLHHTTLRPQEDATWIVGMRGLEPLCPMSTDPKRMSQKRGIPVNNHVHRMEGNTGSIVQERRKR